MKAYKVTLRGQSLLVFNSPLSLQYIEGEKTWADKGTWGIFCYKRLRDIPNFYRNRNHYHIYKVKTLGRIRKPRWIINFSFGHMSPQTPYRQSVLNSTQKIQGIVRLPRLEPEPGVICADGVKIMKRMHYNQQKRSWS